MGEFFLYTFDFNSKASKEDLYLCLKEKRKKEGRFEEQEEKKEEEKREGKETRKESL